MKSPVPFPAGAPTFQRMYTRLGCQGRPPRFVVEFYPYANLTHTIRLRDDIAHVRLSDLLRTAPLGVLEAAAAILLARLYRRRLPPRPAQVYRDYSVSHCTRRRVALVRRRRARRAVEAPRGQHYDLVPLCVCLNREYFGGKLQLPQLGWSARPWRRQLGCFDPPLNQIVLSSRLDRKDVPEIVVEYVLYHEMLHVKHRVRRARCTLQSHSASFRREEQRFRGYARARSLLARLVPFQTW